MYACKECVRILTDEVECECIIDELAHVAALRQLRIGPPTNLLLLTIRTLLISIAMRVIIYLQTHLLIMAA